ncbi:MAG: hypothetical protein AAF642_07575 [Pseudomonadota bacterium]
MLLAHMAVFAAILSYRPSPIPNVNVDSVEIEFAEIEAEPLEVEPVEIVPVSERAPVIERSVPQDVADPPTSPSDTSNDLDLSPPVLMQDAPQASEALPAEVMPGADTSQAPGSVGQAELAVIVQTLNCQRLTHHRDDSCPKPDPFDVAEASQARLEAAPAPPLLVGDFEPKSYLEYFLSQEDREPFLMPGMSADLFTPAMPKGAYNAERIRNGKAPLWDKDMEAGFTRDE